MLRDSCGRNMCPPLLFFTQGIESPLVESPVKGERRRITLVIYITVCILIIVYITYAYTAWIGLWALIPSIFFVFIFLVQRKRMQEAIGKLINQKHEDKHGRND